MVSFFHPHNLPALLNLHWDHRQCSLSWKIRSTLSIVSYILMQLKSKYIRPHRLMISANSIYLRLKISCDLSKSLTRANISASLLGHSLSSSDNENPVILVNSLCGLKQLRTPFFSKKLLTFTQSRYKNSSPFG